MRRVGKINKGIGIFVLAMIIIFGYKKIVTVSSVTESEYPVQKNAPIPHKEIITEKKKI